MAASRWGGGGESCTACGLVVFVAERASATRGVWHQDCFRCSVCNKKLTSSDWRQADASGDATMAIFCTPHFAQLQKRNSTSFTINVGTAMPSAAASPASPKLDTARRHREYSRYGRGFRRGFAIGLVVGITVGAFVVMSFHKGEVVRAPPPRPAAFEAEIEEAAAVPVRG